MDFLNLFLGFLAMVKAAPKVPVKPKPKKQTKALVPLPVTVVPRDPLGSGWTEEDLVQNLVPEDCT